MFASCTDYKNTASIFPVSCLDVIPFHSGKSTSGFHCHLSALYPIESLRHSSLLVCPHSDLLLQMPTSKLMVDWSSASISVFSVTIREGKSTIAGLFHLFIKLALSDWQAVRPGTWEDLPVLVHLKDVLWRHETSSCCSHLKTLSRGITTISNDGRAEEGTNTKLLNQPWDGLTPEFLFRGTISTFKSNTSWALCYI